MVHYNLAGRVNSEGDAAGFQCDQDAVPSGPMASRSRRAHAYPWAALHGRGRVLDVRAAPLRRAAGPERHRGDAPHQGQHGRDARAAAPASWKSSDDSFALSFHSDDDSNLMRLILNSDVDLIERENGAAAGAKCGGAALQDEPRGQALRVRWRCDAAARVLDGGHGRCGCRAANGTLSVSKDPIVVSCCSLVPNGIVCAYLNARAWMQGFKKSRKGEDVVESVSAAADKASEASAEPQVELPVVVASTQPLWLSQTHDTQDLSAFAPKIVVVGVGGAGGNAVNNMIARGLQGVEFLVCNTDAQHLRTTLTENRVQMGPELTGGLGCGANPEVGREAAESAIDEIMERVKGANMMFVTAGMGGGTGTGAAPVIAQAAVEAGILTVAVVTKLAEYGLSELKQSVDTMIVIPNQNLFNMSTERTSLMDAFRNVVYNIVAVFVACDRLADDVLLDGVKNISDLMVMPGLINLDFADVQSVMSNMGNAMMGSGEAEGDNRALRAAEMALANPLLGDISIKDAKGLLVNITGGSDLTLFEVDEAGERVTKELEDPHANIIFGSSFDESLNGKIRVSIVATGIADPDKK
ncbi:Cell division protein ftsz, partial [Globisporangium splendens]